MDLEGVGRRADGYTGADLSALLSEAQLAAVHERLEEGTSVQDAAAQVPLLLMMAVCLLCAKRTVPENLRDVRVLATLQAVCARQDLSLHPSKPCHQTLPDCIVDL